MKCFLYSVIENFGYRKGSQLLTIMNASSAIRSDNGQLKSAAEREQGNLFKKVDATPCVMDDENRKQPLIN